MSGWQRAASTPRGRRADWHTDRSTGHPTAQRTSQRTAQAGSAAASELADPLEQARAIALRALTRSPKSEAELRTRLLGHGVDSMVADELMERLRDVGLVNDADYAAMIVRTRHAERGLAPRAIEAELARRGIDPALRATVLEDLGTEALEDRARQLVSQRVRSMAGLEPAVRYRRLAGMLQRKGYPFAVVTQALRGLEDELAALEQPPE